MTTDTIITLVLIIIFLFGTSGYLLHRCLTSDKKEAETPEESREN